MSLDKPFLNTNLKISIDIKNFLNELYKKVSQNTIDKEKQVVKSGYPLIKSIKNYPAYITLSKN